MGKQGKAGSKKPKHVPQRTCIACRQVAGKRALIRVVRTPQGVEIDRTGKKAGRGAYIHPARACWQLALETRRIEQALRTKMSNVERQQILDFIADLPAVEPDMERAQNENVYVEQK